MLQRIQTVFLLIATIVLGMLYTNPLAEISDGVDVYLFNIYGIFKGSDKIFNGISLLIFLSVIVALHVYIIFAFKNRIRQMRILSFTIILILGLFGLFFYFAYAAFEGETVSFKITVALPLAAVILDYLAVRNIGKDEALVRSVDRLRK
jgi:hypothetical protein